MNWKPRIFLAISIALVGTTPLVAQDDETRSASGLPTKIGENTAPGSRMNVSGRIKLEGAEGVKPTPIVTVHITQGGNSIQRATTNDAGIYLIQGVPRQNIGILVEVNGNEVARQPITSSTIGNQRIDMTIPWPIIRSDAKPGVIVANKLFQRTAKNEELFEKALAAGKALETKKAVDLFNEILTSEPKDFVAWTELGTVYFRANSLDNAEACYFKAIVLRSDYFAALINLGKLYLSRKRLDDAILVLSNAVASNPTSAEARHYLGESYLQAKKGSLAVPQLNEAIRLAPAEKADLHLRLASLYDAAGMKAKAAAEYKMFLEKRPEHPEKKQLEKYIAENLSK
ncbi:MAG: tetratricopeptide repeat protein [Pyrinomonadaceae bacterium]|nr:tetratricopeptide repeat protein [Pyrinomonadaceae bacterium]